MKHHGSFGNPSASSTSQFLQNFHGPASPSLYLASHLSTCTSPLLSGQWRPLAVNCSSALSFHLPVVLNILCVVFPPPHDILGPGAVAPPLHILAIVAVVVPGVVVKQLCYLARALLEARSFRALANCYQATERA